MIDSMKKPASKMTGPVTLSSYETRERIRAIAQREGISESRVIAQIVEGGLAVRERESVRNYGRK
jgi:hypothetical protein